ncbi:MAG TPA: S24/S26 family peptidase [Thermoanaerobaculia bacterium]|nr:S24/S26 family peptidase [Thermoanaerobaculia bacterium]
MSAIKAADVIADLLARGHAVEFRVHGDSMHPVIREEDVLHVEPSSEYRVGDVVLMLADRGLTAHRVISLSGDEVVTRGDNTPAPDAPIARTRVLGVVTSIERNGARLPVQRESWPLRLLRREQTLTLFALYLCLGLCLLLYAWKTVHRHPVVSERAQTAIAHWVQHGYFASAGMMFIDEQTIYRWTTGGYLVTAFLAVSAGVPLHVHNMLVAMLLATALALLAYRIARRCDAGRLHAFVLGAAVQGVQFTFPENLALVSELSPQAYALLFAAIFLLRESRLAAFTVVYLEPVFGTFFLAAYALASLLLREERRVLAGLLVPWAAAIGVYGVQVAYAGTLDAKLTGSSMMYRTGLDGDTQFYRDHRDIAHQARDAVRGHGNVQLYRWPALFLAGTIAAILAIAAYIARRAPRAAFLALVSLLGGYLLYAAIFSQAVALHPYLYDTLLATPLILALFAIAPALVEVWTRRSGAVIVLMLFAAIWLAAYQLRVYAIR